MFADFRNKLIVVSAVFLLCSGLMHSLAHADSDAHLSVFECDICAHDVPASESGDEPHIGTFLREEISIEIESFVFVSHTRAHQVRAPPKI